MSRVILVTAYYVREVEVEVPDGATPDQIRKEVGNVDWGALPLQWESMTAVDDDNGETLIEE
jgi:hypothetical protein